MATVPQYVTDADLLTLPRDGRKYEVVDGAIRVSPAGFRHGVVSVRLVQRLSTFVSEARLGYVLDSSTGYRLPNGNLRSPDVSFVHRDRLPTHELPVGFAAFAPDLAVEVLSPEDRQRDILDKVGEYLAAGVALVWVIDPETRSAGVFRSLTDISHVDHSGDLDGEHVLPGFRCRLADLLE
jgi:Uma2 family endonuclease